MVDKASNKTTKGIVALVKEMIVTKEEERITMDELMLRVREVEKIGVEEYSSQERLEGPQNNPPSA